MIISEISSRDARPTLQDMQPRPGDVLNMLKFNSLPSPVTARMCGGSEWRIETLDVQTGLMLLDVAGKLDRSHFAEVMMLIDIDGIEHDPEDFWLE